MSVSRVASRYAKSLIDLAREKGELERIYQDIVAFKEAIENKDFVLFIKSPIIHADKKKKVMEAIFGDSLHVITSSFINILISKGREAHLADIAEHFINQYEDIKHISTVQLTSATDLSDEMLDQIKAKLAASTELYDNVRIKTKIDPSILGGFIIEYGDKLYDASVAYSLKKLRNRFEKSGLE
jgi:F-type H+-transporting ATPase subunit delta